MEHLVLGLLILSPMTGYELQQFIKQNLALICSHSAGSVQTALAKLDSGRDTSPPPRPPRAGGAKDLLHHGGWPRCLFRLGCPAHAGG